MTQDGRNAVRASLDRHGVRELQPGGPPGPPGSDTLNPLDGSPAMVVLAPHPQALNRACLEHTVRTGRPLVVTGSEPCVPGVTDFRLEE